MGHNGYNVEGENVIKAGLGHGDKVVNNNQWFTNGAVNHLKIVMRFRSLIWLKILLMHNGVDKLNSP
jgi:hypothetical protein